MRRLAGHRHERRIPSVEKRASRAGVRSEWIPGTLDLLRRRPLCGIGEIVRGRVEPGVPSWSRFESVLRVSWTIAHERQKVLLGVLHITDGEAEPKLIL